MTKKSDKNFESYFSFSWQAGVFVTSISSEMTESEILSEVKPAALLLAI